MDFAVLPSFHRRASQFRDMLTFHGQRSVNAGLQADLVDQQVKCTRPHLCRLRCRPHLFQGSSPDSSEIAYLVQRACRTSVNYRTVMLEWLQAS